MGDFEKSENCTSAPFGMTGNIKVIPACMATENGTKVASGWECVNCTEEVRACVAERLAEVTLAARALVAGSEVE